MIDAELKKKAIVLRQKGYSYSYISAHTGLAKGTLSYMLSDIKSAHNAHTRRIILSARKKVAFKRALVKRQSLMVASEYAESKVGNLSERDLLFVGIGLYMGEGSKTKDVLRLSNSDPHIICLFIRWLRVIMNIPLSHIRIRLHLYPDLSESKCIDFWSKMTKIPKEHFQKSLFDDRIKKVRVKKGLGTCHLGVKGVGVLKTRQIHALMDSVFRQITRD